MGDENGSYLINKILFSKWIAVLFVIIASVVIIGSVLSRSINEEFNWNIVFYPTEVVILIYLLLMVLSSNMELVKQTMHKFDFWVKVLYTLRLAISTLIIVGIRMTVEDVLSQMIYLVAILSYSMIDGIQMPYKMKIATAMLLATHYSFFAIMYTFVWDSNEFYILHIIGSLNVNVTALVTSSFRIIALFIWKQTYKLIFKKGKSTALTGSIIIKWVE